VLIQGVITERDYVRAQYLHLSRARAFVGIGFSIVAAYLWATYLEPLWIGFLFPLFLISLYAVVVPFRSRRTFRQYKALSEPVSIEKRADGLYFKRQHGEGLLPWSHIVKWRRNETLVLLYPANNVFHMVPGHFFPSESDFEAFKALVQEHVGYAA
jgi:hypothetical protein